MNIKYPPEKFCSPKWQKIRGGKNRRGNNRIMFSTSLSLPASMYALKSPFSRRWTLHCFSLVPKHLRLNVGLHAVQFTMPLVKS